MEVREYIRQRLCKGKKALVQTEVLLENGQIENRTELERDVTFSDGERRKENRL